MRHGKSIAVVIPAYCEATQIGGVLRGIPEFVDHIVVVDDCSPDTTSDAVRDVANDDARVDLVRHDTNKGAGASIVTGHRRALELGADVSAVMDGDGQMPVEDLAALVDPVALGTCDYAKANRLQSGEAWGVIPRKRYLGNAVLSFLTKIASGYYNVVDSQTGFTAIATPMLDRLDLDSIYPRYGYPNDMLVRLNVARARVMDVPSRPVYGVGENSHLKIRKVLFTMSWLLLKRFWWRMGRLYILQDFHPLVLFYTLGWALLFFGISSGIALIAYAMGDNDPTGTGPLAVLVSMAVQSGLLLVLFGMLFDFQHNRHLNPNS